LSSFTSDRIELTVRTWEGPAGGGIGVSSVKRSNAVTVRPLFRTASAVVCRDVARGRVLTEEDVQEEERWESPGLAMQRVSVVSVLGRMTGQSLKAGEPILKRDVRQDALIKRGDLTVVRCIVGGAVLSLQAEARADGCEGESIEFRKPGERDTFLAVVAGRGEAVIDLSRRE
jgi:flagella basal body P-ring formation protein FlgA